MSLTDLRTDMSTYQQVLTDLDNLGINETNKKEANIFFKNKLYLKNVNLFFNNKERKILDDLNLEINKNNIVGIFGKSGSGKTSIVNIISGLVNPNSGELIVDHEKLKKENLNSWYDKISYVPQSTFLFNATLKDNITFFSKNFDEKKFIKCIKKAGLEQLYEKFDCNPSVFLNEKGSNLSFGESQRIGLARAFYKDTEILILDEFTSALDNKNEREIMEKLTEQKNEISIILTTHKIELLKYCDQIIGMSNGKIILNEKNIKNRDINKLTDSVYEVDQ